MMTQKTTFEEALEEDDWGLIISKDGILKGMFVPDGEDEDIVPQTIIDICKSHFGVDVTEEVTLH